MESINWTTISLEHYIIAGLGFLTLIFFITILNSNGKLKKIRKQQIADKIDLDEAGKREKWFRVFTESIPQVFWIQNQIKTLFISPHFEDLIGSSESIIRKDSKGLLEICHPDDIENFNQAHLEFRKDTSQALDVSFRIRKGGTDSTWIRKRIFQYRHFTGEVFFIGLLEDVTEKQSFIEHIKNNRLQLDNILGSIDEGIFGLDREFKPIYWNKEMEVITGMKQDEILNGDTLFEHFPHLLKNGVSEAMKEALLGNSSEPATYPYLLQNKRKGFTRDKYLPLINARDEITGVIGFINDITEELAKETILEKTQEHYTLTLQAINDGIWDWDLSSNNIIFSDRWFEMLGYSPDELSSSMKTFSSLMVEESDNHLLTFARNKLINGEIVELEFQMKHKSGDIKWMMIRGKGIEISSDGNSRRAIGTQTDITQRKNYELDLLEAKEKAEVSDRLKSSFLANISHEIRTPMNAIIGFTDLLIADDSDIEQKNNFQVQIREHSDKLLQLISDIVELSEIESEQPKIIVEDVELISLLKKSALKVYKGFGPDKAKNVAMKIQIPAQTKKMHIQSNPDILQKILQSIIHNACTFTEKGKIDIGFLLPNDNRISIFIRDTGIGIKAEDQERIFKQFEQIDHGLTRSHEGTGLGLTLANRLIKQLQGDISVESEFGKGSCFYLSLPYQTPSNKP